MRIQHRPNTTHNRLDSLGQQLIQFLRRAGVFGPEITARSGFGDACVVGRRREGDVEFFVGCFGAETVGVDEEERFTGGVPSCLMICQYFGICAEVIGRVGPLLLSMMVNTGSL